ncbi:MAG: metal-dependent hydrolase [Candidatus Heimdallarchaeaceae archaeon]
MPFTPFHLGFALIVLGLLPFLDPIALVLGTVLIDLEGLFFILFNIGQLHGSLHSLLGVFALFFPISTISYITNRHVNVAKFYRFNWGKAIFSSILGLVSHLFFDAIIYPEMRVLYPFSNKAGFLYNIWSSSVDHLILSIFGLLGVILIICRVCINKVKSNRNAKSKLLNNQELSEVVTNDKL